MHFVPEGRNGLFTIICHFFRIPCRHGDIHVRLDLFGVPRQGIPGGNIMALSKGSKAAIAAAAILAVVYGAGTAYFSSHSFPNTTIDGREASLRTEEEALGIVRDAVAGEVAEITVDGQTFKVPVADFLSVANEDGVKEAFSAKSPAAWPAEIFRTHMLSSGKALSCNTEVLTERLRSSGLFDLNHDAVDAVISDYTSGSGYEVVPDEDGWQASPEEIAAAVQEAVVSGNTSIDLTEQFAVKAAVRADDPALNAEVETLNRFAGSDLTLKIGDAVRTLPGDMLASWITETRDGVKGLDAEKIEAYAASLQGEFQGDLDALAEAEFARKKEAAAKEQAEQAAQAETATVSDAEALKTADAGKQKAGAGKKAADADKKAEAEAEAEPEAFKYIVDTARFLNMFAAEMDVVMPVKETESETYSRNLANRKIMRTAEKAAKKAKTEEEKQKILAEAEAKTTPAPEMIAVPADGAAAASKGTVPLTRGCYIEYVPDEEVSAQRAAKAKKGLGPATRSNAVIAEELIELAEAAYPEETEFIEPEAHTLYIPLIEASPEFETGYGMDYIDVNIEKQHVILFENAKKVMETDCVTGRPTKDRMTHKGVFTIDYKQRNRILRGSQRLYASFVNFWMPFDGGIGLHDATWRGSFGGNIYKSNGSHGCVNLPLSFAKKLYPRVYAGETVYVH